MIVSLKEAKAQYDRIMNRPFTFQEKMERLAGGVRIVKKLPAKFQPGYVKKTKKPKDPMLYKKDLSDEDDSHVD